jgi:DNA-binding transcriptional ArsR family regulator
VAAKSPDSRAEGRAPRERPPKSPASRAGARAEVPASTEVAADDCHHEHHTRRVPALATSALTIERAAALFRALGDSARLSLLERLATGEYCVTELAEATGEGLSTISQRLRTLRSERLLRRRRVGKHVYYSLADAHVAALIHSAVAHASEQH